MEVAESHAHNMLGRNEQIRKAITMYLTGQHANRPVKPVRPQSTSTRLNKIFILFNLAYRLKALLPTCIGGNIVADGCVEVKIEQNNCYCSIRAANVVYGAGATMQPVS